jgi:iron transport multicopper oxidase
MMVPCKIFNYHFTAIDKFYVATTVLTLGDWIHQAAPAGPKFPTPNATVFNGVGRYDGGPAVPLTVLTVTPGKRYRIRLISISCDPNYIFTIDGHNMTIIEADGVNTQPVTVDSIQIFAGQRYSFILNASQPVKNYWIRAFPNIGVTGFLQGINSAVLRYQGAPTADPLTNATSSYVPLSEQSLVPLESPGAPGSPFPGGADVNINLSMDFDGATENFSINGQSFVPPTVPILLQIMSGAQIAQNLIPSENLYTLPPNKVIEISMPGGAIGGPHPFHLHGHVFDVIRSAGMSNYNFVNPPRRDVVSNGIQGDNVTIRFVTDNPGPWFLHCHIDWHLQAGLAVIFAEDMPDVNATETSIPTAWGDLCPNYNNFTGN